MHRPAPPTKAAAALILTTLTLGLPATQAQADVDVLGAGRWSCAEMIGAADTGNSAGIGQVAGWGLGYRSGATFTRETGFADIVEPVAGQAICQNTVAQCRNAPPDTML